MRDARTQPHSGLASVEDVWLTRAGPALVTNCFAARSESYSVLQDAAAVFGLFVGAALSALVR